MKAWSLFGIVAVVAIPVALSACWLNNTAVSVPEVLPIVQDTLPEEFISSGETERAAGILENRSISAENDINEIRSRLFSPGGPTDFQACIKRLDDRIDELEARTARVRTIDAKPWSVPVGDTGIPLKTMYFQYQSSYTGPNSSGVLYYGNANGSWFLADIQIYDRFELGGENGSTEIPTMAVLSRIDEDANSAEVYQLGIEKWNGEDHAVILQILANRSTGVFEIATASTYDGTIPANTASMYTGLGCGVRMKTDGTNIYATGMFSNEPDCGDPAAYCVRSDDFSEGTGDCAGISTFSSMDITKESLNAANAGPVMREIIIRKTGMPQDLQEL